jgi:hypothetical protein
MARQAADDLSPRTLCGLDAQPVCTPDGRAVGRLFDLSCPWTPGEARSPIGELVYGRAGLLERVGLLERQPPSVPWSAVQRVTTHGLVLHPQAPEPGPARRLP